MTDNDERTPNGGVASEREDGISIAASNGRLSGQHDLRLHFHNVSYSVKKNKSNFVTILNKTCGEFKSGRLTAILGPSGAGKTSMLNVLSGFKANGVTGQFQLNNEERNLLAFRKMSSYIPQDFAMIDLLTVEETLKVSTDLKLPMETSTVEKLKKIDDIIEMLNMEKCRQTLVRNISGGERKRLSIGIELVTNPPVMFFDEPTSGLDSVASLQIINYLRKLARDGRIIVCVVHQPSSRLMKLFDDVLVMSRGEVLYVGPQRDVLTFFKQSGFVCPNYYNPADFLLEVGSESHDARMVELIQRNKDKFSQKSVIAEPVNEKTELLANNASHSSIDMETNHTHVYHHTSNNIRPKELASSWRQFSVLAKRSLRSMSRNLISVQMRLAMHFVVGILLGIVFWQIGDDAARTLTNASCIFFLVMFVFFGNAMPSILLCPQDTAVFIREYLNGWYSIRAYYLSKIISDLPMQIACPTVFIAIVYYMTGQPPAAYERFLMCWIISILAAFIGHFIGLVFGSTFDMQMAIFLVPGVTIPFMIFSGFFIRINELANFLRPLCDISFFRYTMEGLMRAIYGYGRADLTCHEDFCYYKSPQKFLKDFGMLGDRFCEDVIALFIWIFALKVLFYFSLLLRIRKAQ